MERRGLELFDFTLRSADLVPMLDDPWHREGMHMGRIIRAAREAAGEKIDGIEGEQDGYRAQMGFLFERALGIAWKQFWAKEREHVETQLHVELDRVRGTPDGFDKENHRLESVKLTWKSARKWNEDYQQYFWSWLMAEGGYAWMLSHELGDPVLECLFIIGFVNGDYKGPWRLGVWSEVVRWKLEEMQDNWAGILRYRDYLEALDRGQGENSETGIVGEG
jgi:hypothetical protein